MRRIETHSSWLLLGGERVLKLKKPVRSPFLDFTTVQARGRKAWASRSPKRRRSMHPAKKGNPWHFGMKTHIAVDADSGRVHKVTTTPANEADIEQIAELLHRKGRHVWADSG